MTFFLTLFFYPNYQEDFTVQLFMDILDCSHLFHIAITPWNSTPWHIPVVSAFSPFQVEAFKPKVYCSSPSPLRYWSFIPSLPSLYFIYHRITKTFGDCRFLAGVSISEVPTWRLWHWRMQHSLLPNTSITSLQAAPTHSLSQGHTPCSHPEQTSLQRCIHLGFQTVEKQFSLIP